MKDYPTWRVIAGKIRRRKPEPAPANARLDFIRRVQFIFEPFLRGRDQLFVKDVFWTINTGMVTLPLEDIEVMNNVIYGGEMFQEAERHRDASVFFTKMVVNLYEVARVRGDEGEPWAAFYDRVKGEVAAESALLEQRRAEFNAKVKAFFRDRKFLASIGLALWCGILVFADFELWVYQLSRWAITAASIWIAVDRKGWRAALMWVAAVLYNPVAPVHFPKEIWTWVNVLTAAALLLSARRPNDASCPKTAAMNLP